MESGADAPLRPYLSLCIKHYGSAEIVQKLGELLAQAYPDVCDKSLFRIYDRCDDYIKAHLQLGAANL